MPVLEQIKYEFDPSLPESEMDFERTMSGWTDASPAFAGIPLSRGIKVLPTWSTQKRTSSLAALAADPRSWYQHSAWSRKDTRIVTPAEIVDLLRQINDLAFQGEGDEFGLLRPSIFAFRACNSLILDLISDGYPPAPSDIGVDRNGDIRITWTSKDREAELVFPSEQSLSHYLYYSSPDSYGTEMRVTKAGALKWINWVMAAK
jgi:hypothetical protein